MHDVKVDFSSAEEILRKHGFQRGGPVQRLFTSEVKRISRPYMPFDRGVMSGQVVYGKTSAIHMANMIETDEYHESLIYYAPYARYHWYGKLMVSPTTGSSWAKHGEQKVLTERNMKYQGAPIRGPRWVERAWIDHGQEVVQGIQRYVDSGGKTIG